MQIILSSQVHTHLQPLWASSCSQTFYTAFTDNMRFYFIFTSKYSHTVTFSAQHFHWADTERTKDEAEKEESRWGVLSQKHKRARKWKMVWRIREDNKDASSEKRKVEFIVPEIKPFRRKEKSVAHIEKRDLFDKHNFAFAEKSESICTWGAICDVFMCLLLKCVPVYFYLVGLSLQSIVEGPGLCKLLVELVYLLLMLLLHVLPLLLKLLQILRATQMSTLYIHHHRCLFL